MSKQLCEDFALLALLSGYFNVSETIGRVFGYAGTDLGGDPVYSTNVGKFRGPESVERDFWMAEPIGQLFP